MSDALSLAIAGLAREETLETVRRRLESDEDPLAILDECRRGMALVGDRFQSGDYFLAELLRSTEIFKEAVALLEPRLSQSAANAPRGKVVLATMRGDIHDLGKNLLAALLRAHAFEVHDLGVDVEPRALVEKVKEVEPDFVGFSALITIAFGSMKEAADMLRDAGLRHRFKLMVGGGVTTPSLMKHIGADFQSVDAVEGVAYCLKALTGESA
jgi:methanogenic corrinoid protein MtbC1